MPPTAKPRTIAPDLLDRYFAGESSAEECAHVDAWLAAHPDQAARLAGPVALTRDRVEADWTKIVARLEEGRSESWTSNYAHTKHLSRPSQLGTQRLLRTGQEHRSSLGQTLRRVVASVFDGFAGSAMATLFGRKVTRLSAAEIERWQELLGHADRDDE